MDYFGLFIALCFFIFFYRVGMYEYRSSAIALCMGAFSVILLFITDFGGRYSMVVQIVFQVIYFFSLGFIRDIKKWLKKGR